MNANLLGTVTDQTKASVPGATVTITETRSGASKTMQTNAAATMTLKRSSQEHMRSRRRRQGFRQAKVENVAVVVNTTVRMDVTLLLGSTTESVTVTSAPDVLKTDRADVGIDISSQQAEELPLGTNRNFQGLACPGSRRDQATFSAFDIFQCRLFAFDRSQWPVASRQ